MSEKMKFIVLGGLVLTASSLVLPMATLGEGAGGGALGALAASGMSLLSALSVPGVDKLAVVALCGLALIALACALALRRGLGRGLAAAVLVGSMATGFVGVGSLVRFTQLGVASVGTYLLAAGATLTFAAAVIALVAPERKLRRARPDAHAAI